MRLGSWICLGCDLFSLLLCASLLSCVFTPEYLVCTWYAVVCAYLVAGSSYIELWLLYIFIFVVFYLRSLVSSGLLHCILYLVVVPGILYKGCLASCTSRCCFSCVVPGIPAGIPVPGILCSILYLFCILYDLVSCTSKYLISCILYLVSCILCLVSCILYLVYCIPGYLYCTLYLVYCTWYLVSGIWYLAYARCLVSDVLYLVSTAVLVYS